MKTREIKFRAWDTEGRELYPNVQNHINDEVFAFGNMIMNKERFKLMQYTGLKDKNGKEIYEGDLLKTGDENKKPKTTFTEVYWCENRAMFRQNGDFIGGGGWTGELNTWENYLKGIMKLSRFEIIGNIYENPELLTNKQK